VRRKATLVAGLDYYNLTVLERGERKKRERRRLIELLFFKAAPEEGKKKRKKEREIDPDQSARVSVFSPSSSIRKREVLERRGYPHSIRIHRGGKKKKRKEEGTAKDFCSASNFFSDASGKDPSKEKNRALFLSRIRKREKGKEKKRSFVLALQVPDQLGEIARREREWTRRTTDHPQHPPPALPHGEKRKEKKKKKGGTRSDGLQIRPRCGRSFLNIATGTRGGRGRGERERAHHSPRCSQKKKKKKITFFEMSFTSR